MAKRKRKYFSNVFIFSLYSQACWNYLPLAVKTRDGSLYCQGQGQLFCSGCSRDASHCVGGNLAVAVRGLAPQNGQIFCLTSFFS